MVHGDSGATELSRQIPAMEEFLQSAGRRYRQANDPLLNPIIPKRGVLGIKVGASPQPVEHFPLSRVVGVPLQELREHRPGLAEERCEAGLPTPKRPSPARAKKHPPAGPGVP